MSRWPISPSAVALDVLDDAQRPLVERLLREDAAFCAEVERARALGARLAVLPEAAWAPPPAASIDPAPAPRGALAPQPAAARPAHAGHRAWRRRRPIFAAAALAATAAVVATVALSGGGASTASAPDGRVALAPFDEGRAGATALVSLPVTGGSVRLRATLPPSHDGERYELWLIPAHGTRLVALGTFRAAADGRARMVAALHVDPRRYAFLDVSRESDDGDPGHSGHSLLRAPVPS